jgi:hypothetical protein
VATSWEHSNESQGSTDDMKNTDQLRDCELPKKGCLCIKIIATGYFSLLSANKSRLIKSSALLCVCVCVCVYH